MSDATAPRPRGRPRSERARHAILDAATTLLLTQGLDAVSMDAVAQRAAVSKATIYRWWPTKYMLALDALCRELDVDHEPQDTGGLRSDLLDLLQPFCRRALEREHGRVIGPMITEVHRDDDFALEYAARFVRVRRAPAAKALRRAMERGELPADTDLELALDLIYGPLWHRLLHRHAPLNDEFIERVVDAALTGLGAPGPAG